LAFHFFARHIAMDCWEKRQRKGYLFMTGDEPSNTTLSGALVKQWLGSDLQDMPLADVIADVRRTFHPFFIAPDRKRGAGVSAFWTPYLGDSFISLDDPADTCAAAAGLVALGEGAVKGLAQLEASLTKSGNTRAKQVVEALRPWAAANGKA
jgi:hypothetical protein